MKKRTLVILALALAAAAVVAAVFFLWPRQSADRTLLDYLGATEEEAAWVADGLVTPNASITLDDTKITVTQMLYDDRFAYLAYEIELPEDFPEDAPPPWLGTSFCLAPTGSDEKDSWHDYLPISEERSGRVIRAIAEVHLAPLATEDAYDAILFLTRPEDETGEDYRELRWSMTGSPLARTYTPNEKVREDGPVLTRLSVSPLSVYAMMEGSEPINGLTVCVFFRDGTMFDATRARVSSYSDVAFLEDGTMVIHGGDVGYPFGKIMDVSTIERIVVGDVEIIMDEENDLSA